MKRAARLKELAFETKATIDRLDKNRALSREDREADQWQVFSEALVKGFDILMKEGE